MKILIINGPNLNMLGLREPDLYGKKDYNALVEYVAECCKNMEVEHEIFQSNHEGEIVEKIQQAYKVFAGIVINAAAYTHTSVAILDALKAVSIPAVEVHLTDISAREPFRHISYTGMYCEMTYKGLGFEGYKKAIEYLWEKYK
ncbi:MAG: type II 3-dehydroquinate dehydratase [Clostridia bacterium]|nr:type II 3-dehydroquinate dehydratase [Clostridia bacterium]